jgi:hypothetical protein
MLSTNRKDITLVQIRILPKIIFIMIFDNQRNVSFLRIGRHSSCIERQISPLIN